jgi:hypothetical protein
MALVTAAAGGLGCSARTLIAVGPCLDGSASVDGAACAPDGAATANLRNGLIGLWHFDETSGAAMAADSSGLANHGTLMELDPSTAWVVKGGKLGNALAVEGLGYVVVPSASVSSIVSAVTVSAWVYVEGTIASGNNYGTAVSRQIGTSNNQYYHLALWQAEARPHVFITTSTDLTGGGPQPLSSSPTPPKVWTHLATTYDGSVATLYVNGDLINSVPRTGTFPVDTTPLILGGNGNFQTVNELFPGRIDEVALYNRALEAAEIQQLANAVSF